MEVLYLSKTLYLRGKARQLAVLNFKNSLKTHLLALKCGSARELMISEKLNSVWQTTGQRRQSRDASSFLVDLWKFRAIIRPR